MLSDFAKGSVIGGGSALIEKGFDTGMGFLAAAQGNEQAEKMYKHRYRWAVNDLTKAGLNPILALGGAGSAGAAMQARLPQSSGMMTSARQGALMKAELRMLREQRNLLQFQQVEQNARNAELVSQIPRWQEEHMVNDSRAARAAFRANRALEISLARAGQIKDLVNPFSGRAKPRLGK